MSFWAKIRSRSFGCIAMSSAVLFILRSRLLVYSTRSGVNCCFVSIYCEIVMFSQEKNLSRYGCMYFYSALELVCGCDGDVTSIGHGLNLCSGGCGMSAV